MKAGFLVILLFTAVLLNAQTGIIIGTVMDEKKKALENATVQLVNMNDSNQKSSQLTDKDGAFSFEKVAFGYYRLKVSYTGLQPVSFDSIYFRADRYDFNMNDIVLMPKSTSMDEVIIYAEKPLIQSKDGNITFNAGESALSAGSSASDLLNNVPLVTKDPDGKLLVRGKEPKVLIDDKPVELNLQQLQDLLESMPGSSIEKIEVMTNPPPQYANEQGGVINIVTKKGAVGMSARVNVNAGTRGEYGSNGSFTYRKQGLALQVNGGMSLNSFNGRGYSHRQNLYADSSNFFNTENAYDNGNTRPNFRTNLTYDINKHHSVNLVLQYNQNAFDNQNRVQYLNINRYNALYRLRDRSVSSDGGNQNPNGSLSYILKTKRLGETLQFIGSWGYTTSESSRDFYEQFLNPDYSFTGRDSSQQVVNANNTRNSSLRLNYDRPVLKTKSVLSLGAYSTQIRSDIEANAYYKRKADGVWADIDALTNHFIYNQNISNIRFSAKQLLGDRFSITAGLSAEQTAIAFDLLKTGADTSNSYWSYLPFATLNKTWKDALNLTFSYKRTVRRPGVGELNPTVDFSDPYNIRFGNPGLKPSMAHNFDLVFGKSKNGFYANIGMGYNDVRDIYNAIRTRLNNDTTQITWQNISGRKEYEVSTWSGYTLNKRTRVNLSASYTYNEYGDYDKSVRKFRNGGSFTSNLNTNYTWNDLYTATGSFTFNRFANPQGTVRSSLSMNLGIQAKFFNKKLNLTLNAIDPIVQQKNRTFTYGTNFILENYNQTQTKNYRLTVGYVFSRTKKKPSKAIQKKLPPPSH